MRVVWWLLGGTVLLFSLTNELVGASAPLASGLRHVPDSGPLGVFMVAHITSTDGQVLLLVVALALLLHADTDARGRSSCPPSSCGSCALAGVPCGSGSPRRASRAGPRRRGLRHRRGFQLSKDLEI